MRPSEMRTMSFTPAARELARNRDVARFGHARRAFGPMFFSTSMSSAVTSRSSLSMRAREVLEVLEHDRAALVLHQLGRRPPTA